MPQVDKARVERSGNQRWLVVSGRPDQLWDQVKDFWQETGFVIKIDMPDVGVMETDWAENRAKIGDEGLRKLAVFLIRFTRHRSGTSSVRVSRKG